MFLMSFARHTGKKRQDDRAKSTRRVKGEITRRRNFGEIQDREHLAVRKVGDRKCIHLSLDTNGGRFWRGGSGGSDDTSKADRPSVRIRSSGRRRRSRRRLVRDDDHIAV